MSAWRTWSGGPRPDTGGKKLLARLRCQTREEVERKGEAHEPGWWKDWQHSGSGGDIVEIKILD